MRFGACSHQSACHFIFLTQQDTSESSLPYWWTLRNFFLSFSLNWLIYTIPGKSFLVPLYLKHCPFPISPYFFDKNIWTLCKHYALHNCSVDGLGLLWLHTQNLYMHEKFNAFSKHRTGCILAVDLAFLSLVKVCPVHLHIPQPSQSNW